MKKFYSKELEAYANATKEILESIKDGRGKKSPSIGLLKECRKCGKEKRVEFFWLNKTKKYDDWCGKCRRKRENEKYEHSETKKATRKRNARKWQIENSQKAREAKRAWARRHREEMKMEKIFGSQYNTDNEQKEELPTSTERNSGEGPTEGQDKI